MTKQYNNDNNLTAFDNENQKNIILDAVKKNDTDRKTILEELYLLSQQTRTDFINNIEHVVKTNDSKELAKVYQFADYLTNRQTPFVVKISAIQYNTVFTNDKQRNQVVDWIWKNKDSNTLVETKYDSFNITKMVLATNKYDAINKVAKWLPKYVWYNVDSSTEQTALNDTLKKAI